MLVVGAIFASLQGGILPDSLQPAPPPRVVERDADYARRLEELRRAESWPWEVVMPLRPVGVAQVGTLAETILAADDRSLPLYATLAADCEGTSPLAHALWCRGTGILPEAAAVACLLAPHHAPEPWWPALAELAARSTAPLPVRAAAIARLLESGCDAAWPWARAVLLTGTARDETPDPIADWQRGGRYELPKRLIVAALDARARARDASPCGFEPNAAWIEQERAVQRIGSQWKNGPPPPRAPLDESWRALMRSAVAGERAAQRALAMLGSARPDLLRNALASADPGLAHAVRRALEERPR